MATETNASDLNADFEQFVNSLPQDAFTSSDSLMGQPAVAGPDAFDPYLLPQATALVRSILVLRTELTIGVVPTLPFILRHKQSMILFWALRNLTMGNSKTGLRDSFVPSIHAITAG